MEKYPLAEYGHNSTQRAARDDRSEEARLHRHAEICRRSAVEQDSGAEMLIERSWQRSRESDQTRPRQLRSDSRRAESNATRTGNDTIYMSAIDRDGTIVSLIQSNYSGFGTGMVAPGTGLRAAQSRRPVHVKAERTEHHRPAQTSAAHDHSRLHGKGSDPHRLRHHGRMESGAGARAVRLERRRLRDEHSGRDGSGAFHERIFRRLRRTDGIANLRKRCVTN